MPRKPYSPFQEPVDKMDYALARADDIINWGRKVRNAHRPAHTHTHTYLKLSLSSLSSLQPICKSRQVNIDQSDGWNFGDITFSSPGIACSGVFDRLKVTCACNTIFTVAELTVAADFRFGVLRSGNDALCRSQIRHGSFRCGVPCESPAS